MQKTLFTTGMRDTSQFADIWTMPEGKYNTMKRDCVPAQSHISQTKSGFGSNFKYTNWHSNTTFEKL